MNQNGKMLKKGWKIEERKTIHSQETVIERDIKTLQIFREKNKKNNFWNISILAISKYLGDILYVRGVKRKRKDMSKRK